MENSTPRTITLDSDIYISRPPAFQHDCDECIYLGSADATRVNDLYIHPGKHVTLITRYGEEEKYTSGLEFAAYIPELSLAMVRAIKKGHLEVNGPSRDSR